MAIRQENYIRLALAIELLPKRRDQLEVVPPVGVAELEKFYESLSRVTQNLKNLRNPIEIQSLSIKKLNQLEKVNVGLALVMVLDVKKRLSTVNTVLSDDQKNEVSKIRTLLFSLVKELKKHLSLKQEERKTLEAEIHSVIQITNNPFLRKKRGATPAQRQLYRALRQEFYKAKYGRKTELETDVSMEGMFSYALGRNIKDILDFLYGIKRVRLANDAVNDLTEYGESAHESIEELQRLLLTMNEKSVEEYLTCMNHSKLFVNKVWRSIFFLVVELKKHSTADYDVQAFFLEKYPLVKICLESHSSSSFFRRVKEVAFSARQKTEDKATMEIRMPTQEVLFYKDKVGRVTTEQVPLSDEERFQHAFKETLDGLRAYWQELKQSRTEKTLASCEQSFISARTAILDAAQLLLSYPSKNYGEYLAFLRLDKNTFLVKRLRLDICGLYAEMQKHRDLPEEQGVFFDTNPLVLLCREIMEVNKTTKIAEKGTERFIKYIARAAFPKG